MYSELISHLKLILEQISDQTTQQRVSPDFDLSRFWEQFSDVSKAVSHSASKIAICCSKPPMPDNQECERLCSDVEKSCLSLVSVFYSLPAHQGSLLVGECRDAVREMVSGMLVLLAQVDHDERLLQSLHYTGTVWEACDAVEKIPRDNRCVLLMRIKETQELVKDALDEIEESLSDDSGGLLPGDEVENRDAWSEDDRLLIDPCLGLVKGARGLLKRFHTGVQQYAEMDDVRHVACMDEVYTSYVSRLSPCVDDLVAGLYAPLQRSAARDNATAMEELLHNAAEFSRTCILWSGSDVSWVDVLVRAVNHNTDRVKTQTRDCV